MPWHPLPVRGKKTTSILSCMLDTVTWHMSYLFTTSLGTKTRVSGAQARTLNLHSCTCGQLVVKNAALLRVRAMLHSTSPVPLARLRTTVPVAEQAVVTSENRSPPPRVGSVLWAKTFNPRTIWHLAPPQVPPSLGAQGRAGLRSGLFWNAKRYGHCRPLYVECLGSVSPGRK